MVNVQKNAAKRKEIFAKEYLIDLNAKRAAIAAGYSEKTAFAAGYRLLQDPYVKAEIQAGMDQRSQKLGITADKVLAGLSEISEVDLAEAYDNEGRLKGIHDIPKHIRRAIKSIKVFEEFEGFGKDRVKVGEVREVQFIDKLKAYELQGRHLKLFSDKDFGEKDEPTLPLSMEQLKELVKVARGGK